MAIESIDVRKDGSPIQVETTGSRFEYNGKPHWLAVARDITWRKQAEAELLEKEESDGPEQVPVKEPSFLLLEFLVFV